MQIYFYVSWNMLSMARVNLKAQNDDTAYELNVYQSSSSSSP